MMASRPRARPRQGPVVALLMLVLVLAPSISKADDEVSQSEVHIQRGVEFRRAGRNHEALLEFQEAYGLAPTPRSRAQIALALQALGAWLEAEAWLEAALQQSDDPWIARYRSVLLDARKTVRSHLATLSVNTHAEDAEVVVDGAGHKGPFPVSIRVRAGFVDVVVKAPGALAARRSLVVAAESDAQVTFDLERSPLPAPAVVASADVEGPMSKRAERPSALVGGIALGGTVLLAAGGVIAWRLRENEVSIWNDDSECLRATAPVRSREQQCAARAEAAAIATALEIAAFAAAAVGAGVSTWFFLPKRSYDSHSASLRCALTGISGFSCTARF